MGCNHIMANSRLRDYGGGDGWQFTGSWLPLESEQSIFDYGATYRGVGCSIVLKPRAAFVTMQGSIASAQIPGSIGLPIKGAANGTPMRFQYSDIAEMLGATTNPAIEGHRRVLLPYSREAFAMKMVKPAMFFEGATGSDAFTGEDEAPAVLDANGNFQNLYAYYDVPNDLSYTLSSVDGDNDTVMGGFAAMAGAAAAGTQATVCTQYNRLNSYTIQEGQGYIMIVCDGLTPGLNFDVEIFQTFEVVADSRVLTIEDKTSGVQISQESVDKALTLTTAVHDVGAGHPIAPGESTKLSENFGQMMQGAVNAVGKEAKQLAGDVGGELAETLGFGADSVAGEVIGDVAMALGGLFL
jgi:hypothetical protein